MVKKPRDSFSGKEMVSHFKRLRPNDIPIMRKYFELKSSSLRDLLLWISLRATVISSYETSLPSSENLEDKILREYHEAKM